MVGVLLSNTAYIGQARFGKNASVPWRPPLRPPRGRAPIPRRPSRQVSTPPEQWIAIPVPALIEAALFEAPRVIRSPADYLAAFVRLGIGGGW